MKTRERIVRGTAERAREPLKKTGSHAPYFLSQEQGRERAGGGVGGWVSYIFLDVWSEPKGPPLQGHDAIKHSEMKCLIGGDKGGRGGKKGK